MRYPGEIKVLYAGRLTQEKGVDLLADTFLRAHASRSRLHLLLAGGGPEAEALRARLGDRATFLGWLEGDALARAYASADVFLFCSRTDTFGQVLVEAAASGLPVVAVDEGGPSSIVVDGETGRLCEPDAAMLAAAVLQLADSPAWRAKLGRASAARRARARTWEASMLAARRGLRPGHRARRRSPHQAGQSGLGSAPKMRAVTDELAEQVTESSGPAADGGATVRRTRSGPEPRSRTSTDPVLYFNRELSWLDFNDRVLQLAEDPRVPLLERVNFCAIYEDNLDEFFMVRVAGLHEKVEQKIDARGADAMAPADVIEADPPAGRSSCASA